MADKIPPRFRKTKSDKWAVMAPVADLESALSAGGKIEVQKKSGDWSSFRVASLGKPFDVDGVEMCYGYGPDEEGDQPAPTGNGAAAGAGGTAGTPRFVPPQSAPDLSAAPAPDPSEPLPEYQGGAEDEWEDF